MVAVSLLVLAATAVLQAAVYAGTGSVALLADLVHNAGDALTALPLAAAFLLRSWTVERWAGFLVVLAILVSAVVSGIVAVNRLLDPRDVDHLWVLAAAGVIGFAGNEVAAVIRLRGGRRLGSAALVADGHHAPHGRPREPRRGAQRGPGERGRPAGRPAGGARNHRDHPAGCAWDSLRMVVYARPPHAHDHPEPGRA